MRCNSLWPRHVGMALTTSHIGRHPEARGGQTRFKEKNSFRKNHQLQHWRLYFLSGYSRLKTSIGYLRKKHGSVCLDYTMFFCSPKELTAVYVRACSRKAYICCLNGRWWGSHKSQVGNSKTEAQVWSPNVLRCRRYRGCYISPYTPVCSPVGVLKLRVMFARL